jgi:Domain of unknown function (DUF4189)
MLLRIFGFIIFGFAIFTFSSDARASRVCENVLVGETPPQIIGFENNNNNKPIYGPPQPIYEERCSWKYGGVAIDPATRTYTSAWNYDDVEAAKDYVVGQCGRQCAWVSFGEDFAYIALSDDDRHSGISIVSSADAERQCQMAGGIDCATVIAASTTASSRYWHFGGIAYDPITGASGAAWNYLRRNEAQQAAVKSCASPNCWGYAFQTGYGGIAMADDSSLFGAWSARSEEGAGKAAVKNCEKDKGKKSCSVVYAGSAVAAPEFKPKKVKKKKG